MDIALPLARENREHGMKNSVNTIRHLELKHQTLESELHSLLNRPYLTPQEYEHARELKKRKLVAKDGITALRQSLDNSPN
jgi:hypothetical protein